MSSAREGHATWRISSRTSRTNCTGVVRWKTFTTANKVHKGQNVQAGLTDITNQAVAEAVDEFASRPDAGRADATH